MTSAPARPQGDPARRKARADPEVRERLAEEWAAGLHGRPGKILKLLSALTLLVSAATTLRGMYLPDRQRLRRLRRVVSIIFDREGRVVLATTMLSGLIQTYAPPLGDTMWGWIATYGSLALIINVADFWWTARKERRPQVEGCGPPRQAGLPPGVAPIATPVARHDGVPAGTSSNFPYESSDHRTPPSSVKNSVGRLALSSNRGQR